MSQTQAQTRAALTSALNTTGTLEQLRDAVIDVLCTLDPREAAPDTVDQNAPTLRCVDLAEDSAPPVPIPFGECDGV